VAAKVLVYSQQSFCQDYGKIKRKAEVLGGEDRRYSCYSFFTSALDEGEWSASCSGCALCSRKGHPVPTGEKAGWAPEHVWYIQSEVRHYIELSWLINTMVFYITPPGLLYSQYSSN
jgi:hypothetical protein